MDLLTYVSAERGRSAAIARELGIPPELISQWSRAVRQVPAERCAALEQACNGAVRRWDLRPDDWHLIWPELKNVKGAPDVPATEAKAD